MRRPSMAMAWKGFGSKQVQLVSPASQLARADTQFVANPVICLAR